MLKNQIIINIWCVVINLFLWNVVQCCSDIIQSSAHFKVCKHLCYEFFYDFAFTSDFC